ncbi:MAG: hypothetical protein J3Q66DRAFT_171406 [Benniella sp.]|nr:MAG: hypothetical protein J3Q66DRAFT_171406 [Benniella sp.]
MISPLNLVATRGRGGLALHQTCMTLISTKDDTATYVSDIRHHPSYSNCLSLCWTFILHLLPIAFLDPYKRVIFPCVSPHLFCSLLFFTFLVLDQQHRSLSTCLVPIHTASFPHNPHTLDLTIAPASKDLLPLTDPIFYQSTLLWSHTSHAITAQPQASSELIPYHSHVKAMDPTKPTEYKPATLPGSSHPQPWCS